MEVQLGKTYEIIAQRNEVEIYWDWQVYRVLLKETDGEFWRGVHDFIDAGNVQLWGDGKWKRPSELIPGITYLAYMAISGKIMKEVDLQRGDHVHRTDAGFHALWKTLRNVYGDEEWILWGPKGRTEWNKVQDGYRYTLWREEEITEDLQIEEQKSRFTRREGTAIVTFKVKVGGENHELKIRDGMNED
jgi:hypothetical protein